MMDGNVLCETMSSRKDERKSLSFKVAPGPLFLCMHGPILHVTPHFHCLADAFSMFQPQEPREFMDRLPTSRSND